MKRILALIPIFLTLMMVSVYAASVKTITLKDGSTIYGEIVSVVNNAYTIRTESIGEIQLYDHQIVSITNKGYVPQKNLVNNAPPMPTVNPYSQGIPAMDTKAIQKLLESQTISQGARGPGGLPGGGGQMGGILKTLTSDPQVMKSMNQVMKDPEMMKLFSDPELMKSISTFDPANPNAQEMLENKSVQKMLDDPEIQRLMGIIANKMNLPSPVQQ